MLPLISMTDQAIYGVALLLGLVVCFFGYRLFRIWLALAGLQTGFFLGLWLGGGLFQNPVLTLVLAITCGILCAGLFAILVPAGAFLAGGGVLALLSVLVMMLLPYGINLYVLLGSFLAGGLLGILSVRPFLILFTAINGAFLAVDSIISLIRSIPAAQYLEIHSRLSGAVLILLLTGLFVFTILGALVQFLMESRRSKRAQQADLAPDQPTAASAPLAESEPEAPDNTSD